jgi:hypothetical protein
VQHGAADIDRLVANFRTFAAAITGNPGLDLAPGGGQE